MRNPEKIARYIMIIDNAASDSSCTPQGHWDNKSCKRWQSWNNSVSRIK